MIIDRCDCIDRYIPLNKGFEKARDFLFRTDLSACAEGRYEIDGERVYAMVAREKGRNKEDALLETHDRYIDIQMVLSGIDTMGWKPRSACSRPSGPHDPDKDIRFYEDVPDMFIPVMPGTFALFFPEDAHMPLISDGLIHKVVVKIKQDQGMGKG